MYLLVTTYMATQPGYVTRDRRRGRKPLFTRDKVMALNVSNIAGYCKRFVVVQEPAMGANLLWNLDCAACAAQSFARLAGSYKVTGSIGGLVS